MDDAIDETGTVPRFHAGDDKDNRVNVEEQLRKEIREVSEYLLEVCTWGTTGEERRRYHTAHI